MITTANVVNWAERIKALRDAGATWLPAGLEVPLETRIITKIREFIQNHTIVLPPQWRYKPWMVESLLADAASTIDRAAAYRREEAELEIRAVRDALDFRDYRAIQGADSDVVDKGSQKSAVESQGKAWASAIAKIPDNATEPLLLTLKALFAGFKETTAVQSGNEEARGGALKSRIKITSDSADQLEQAHQELGNSYNFSDRAKRVERLLLEDLAEAIEKTQCAWAGIKTVFPSIVRVGNDISSVTVGAPPDPGQDGTWVWASTGEACSSYLDALLSWTRNAMRAIEHRTQYEKEYEVLIPLAQDWRGVKALMDKPSLRTLLTKGQNFEVPVGEERFQPGTGRRLIGLGVHWLGKGALTNQLWRVGITVIPPDQSYGDVKIPLSPAYFGHVRDMLTTDELNTTLLGVQSNTNPVGTWHIGWDPYCLNAGDTTDLIGTQVTDVVLILRVRHEPVIK